jgi:hypothetical protein
MRDTLAIVGSHPKTRDNFDFTRTDCDIWGFNEALKEEWFTRADAIFQLHDPVIFRSATNRNDPNHYHWLQTQTECVVYMQDKYDDVPMSERYPLEDAMALSPGYTYFTSTVAYALALAILQGYKRIEIYGVEMETNTEYAHQRPGVAFWIGIAIAHGIEVIHHSSSNLLVAPLYGFEGNVKLPLEYYQERIVLFADHFEKSNQQTEKVIAMIRGVLGNFINSYKADLSPLNNLIVALGQNVKNSGIFDGAKQVNERYLDRCEKMMAESGDYMIVRQEYEGGAAGASRNIKERNETLKEIAIKLGEKRDALNTNDNREKRQQLVKDFMAATDEYIKACGLLGMEKGIMQENFDLMLRVDTLIGKESQPVEIPQEQDVMA